VVDCTDRLLGNSNTKGGGGGGGGWHLRRQLEVILIYTIQCRKDGQFTPETTKGRGETEKKDRESDRTTVLIRIEKVGTSWT